MSTHKHIDRICAAVVVLCVVLTVVLSCAAEGTEPGGITMGYENRLFDTSRVHTIDILLEDWDGFLSTAQNEEYTACSVVIDGEAYKNVGIRGKGNTSLSTVATMNSDRYSFKIEFDQYDTGKTYYGLDKLSLNNLIQDTTYMKDYLTYRMMAEFGAAAPLCSYVQIRVNGEPWGLYLAVEGVEEAERVPGVREIAFTKTVGDTAGKIGSSSDRVGFVIAQADSAEAAVAVCEKALETVKITVK